MMRSPIEVEFRRKAGWGIAAMPPELAITTLYLIRALFAPTTLTLILDPADMRRSTLLINFDYLPDLINEFLISSSTAKLPHTNEITNGENTPG